MKGIIIIVLSPFVAMLAVAACQTIEYHMLNETPVPVFAWVLVLITLIWIAFAASLPKQDYKKDSSGKYRLYSTLTAALASAA